MLECQRHLFDLPDDVTYLNCAAYSPLLTAAHAAGTLGLERKYHPWDMDITEPPREAEELRSLFARLIGAAADDVALVNSTSYGIEIAARNLDVEPGKKIIVIEDQFPSNVFSWRYLAADRGAILTFVDRPADDDWTTAVLAALDDNVTIAALPPCHWSDGSWLDLVAIGARCRELGVPFVIDATQVIGAMPFDVREVQPDFVACSAYKWLFCPYTMGFLYAAPHRQQGLPLEYHRWNHDSPQNVATSVAYAETFNKGARRYDMGEVNNFINLPMAVVALKQLIDWTPGAVQSYLTPLTDAVAEGARARGWRVPADGQRVGHYIGMRPEGDLDPTVVTRLQSEENVFVSQRGGGVRVSPNMYNDMADIERFFAAFDKVLA